MVKIINMDFVEEYSSEHLLFVEVIILIIFTILATYLYHFPPSDKEYYPFMSNVTTIGGLSLLAYVLKYDLFY